jgi:hypothetical protein
MSKIEYELTEDEFAEIKSIAQDSTPVMKFGDYWSGMDKQDRANAFWKLLGEKHGFEWDSASPVPGKAVTFFYAIPTRPKEEPKISKADQEFINRSKDIIKGLNDLTIVHPETSELFNKVTDMLERKIKAIEQPESIPA